MVQLYARRDLFIRTAVHVDLNKINPQKVTHGSRLRFKFS
eukprot:SAG31_NODE_22412_length_526_cov_0.854801_1_plen_39_part_01